MSFWKRIRRVAEGVLLCLGFFWIPFLPRRTIVGLSRWLGGVGFRFCHGLREVTLANLEVALAGELSVEDRRAVALGCFRTFSLVLLDVFWFSVFSERRIETWVTFDESMAEYFRPGPTVIVAAHLGNWEVLGQGMAVRGAPCVSVAAPLDNAFADRVLNRVRKRSGQQITFKQGAVRHLLKALRDGGRVGLVMDQNTLPRDGGEFVPFFGLPVPMSKAVEALSDKVDARVAFVYCPADGRGGYTIFARGVKPEHPGQGMTQAVAATMEEVIREHPKQWLWMYKRWKFIPDDASPEPFPFYSRRLLQGAGYRALEKVEKSAEASAGSPEGGGASGSDGGAGAPCEAARGAD